MKIPTLELRERQRRLSDREIRRRQDITARKRRVRARSVYRTPTTARRIALPEKLRFHGGVDDRHKYGQFVELVDQTLGSGRGVLIDLESVKTLYPCGLLLLMGQVRSWIERFPSRLTANYPTDTVVEQMLQSVGVLQSLGLQARIDLISHTEVTQWRYFTGTQADAQEMAPFMQEVRELIGADEQSLLYDSVVEAITNVRQHAYEEGASTPWWMFATISQRRIVVAIYDRGASIPGTLLEKPGVREQMEKWVAGRKKLDAWLIQAAVKGRSSTKLSYRGKGLPEMLESTKLVSGSALGIFSREGVFSYERTPDKTTCQRLDVPIVGTLVLWQLNLPELPA